MSGYPRKTRTQLRWKHWSCGVEVFCGFTDGEHEIRKPKHAWTDGVLEPAQMTDTETRKVIAMMLVRTEEREVCVLKTYERVAQHEATVSESATDDQKLRMHGEFKAICLMDETRLWSMELPDQQTEHLRCVTEMHVRFR